MKIALVSPYDFDYPGGVTRHIETLACELQARGHTVKILAPCSSSSEGIGKVEIVPCGRPVPIPTAGSVARVSLSIWLQPRLKRMLRDERFDVVHIHEPFMPFLPWVIADISPTTTVATFHAYNEHARRYWFWKPVFNRLARNLDGRIAVSTAARDYVSRHYPGEYEIIPNGIDVERFSQPAPPLPELHDGKLNILFVGRLEKRKGLRYLLGAYSTLKWEFPDLRLVIVGPGTPDADSWRIIGERGVQDLVMTGAVSDEDLPRYYQAADIFCSPATGRESFGIVLLEAMASSTPVVATDIGGYSTVVTHGKQGLLVEPRSEAALVAALRTLVTDASLRRRMAAAGRESVAEYSWEQVAGRVLDLYTSASKVRADRVAPGAA